jgi:hypothetical protein
MNRAEVCESSLGVLLSARETNLREARRAAERDAARGEAEIRGLTSRLEGGAVIKDVIRTLGTARMKELLQHMYMSKEPRRGHRERLEQAMRTAVQLEKKKRVKPKGDFVKVLITSSAARGLKLGTILRAPAVTQLHPAPEEAEQIWVCERNVPPHIPDAFQLPESGR